jgi:hypothetical protein
MADALPRVRKTICCWPYSGDSDEVDEVGDSDEDDEYGDNDDGEESNIISSECLHTVDDAAVAGINAVDEDDDGDDSAAMLETSASSAELDDDGLDSSWSSPSVTALVGRESRVGVTTLMGQKMSNCTHSRPSRRQV